MKRNWAILSMALGVVIAAIVGIVGVGQAATSTPKRSDSSSEPVYFIHGWEPLTRADCNDYWGAAMKEMRTWGWTGPQHTVGFYANDTNCGVTINRGDQSTHIKDLGRKLANEIYSRYSKKGKSVDVLAHSMGGLVIRAALAGTAAKEQGFPPYLYVEDVVTLSTPHRGSAGFTRLCRSVQCNEMSGDSPFLRSLQANPQSKQGTDWTMIGSDDDQVVSADSATNISGGHRVIYRDGSNVNHGNITDTVRGTYKQKYWNAGDKQWHEVSKGAAPIKAASNALFSWSKW
ncbi:hypothetical protein ABT297_30820 [Dactylosporangium sp. NPDC000555]|uniref:esterase/lipase family protein n=1 Tax=Dactylosporangium sp. NPDC000555 TaxID=3154260 RepID=UPI0033177A71